MAVRTFDGDSKADRKGCAVFRTTPKYLATIDFGTTHCSVAYLLRPDMATNPSEVDPTVLKLDNAGNKRVPSCILFDSNGKKVAFGHEAREQFAALNHELRHQHHYFEHVKKNLQYEKNIDRNQQISAMNGKQFFLVDVIAHILHHLKHQLLTVLGGFGYNIKASDFDWVITVPAIWKSRGKSMMREAGYTAGLCSDSEPPPICIATGNHNSPQEEKSPEKLSLALEPESAAIHCQRKATEAGRAPEYVVRPKTYIVIDIGGGTVDIASHSIAGGRIAEIAAPAGNFCGGTTVNEKFSEFLQGFVDDPKFSRYIQGHTLEVQTQHKADLNRLLYGNTGFESQKMRFGSGDGHNSYYFEFPHSFWSLYKDSIVKNSRELNSKGDISVQVEDDGAVMRIDDSKMAEFFQPAIDGITNLIELHLQENKYARTTDTICWVGGFGGCKYLRNQLESIINTTFRGFGFHFPVPPEPELAVIRGATAFRCDPSIVTKRKADATYGVGGFNVVLKESGKTQQPFKSNTFHAFVKRGDDISTNKVFAMNFTARERSQTSATFLVYSTVRREVKYTTDDNIHKLGEVTVPMGGYGLHREIELLCDMTHTEIHIRAHDKTSGSEQKVVVDFLSSRNERAQTSTFKDVSRAHSQTSVRPSEHMELPHKGAVQTPWKNEPGSSTQTLPTPTDTLGAVQTPRKNELEYFQALQMCTDTLDMQHLVDITDPLLEMEKNQIYELGLVLGLNHTKLTSKMDSLTFLEDVIAMWLRQEDYVKMRGEPSWMVLIRALKVPRVGQMGIAGKIAKQKGLQDN